jgi:hypothetical protein
MVGGGGPSPTDCQSFLSQSFQAHRGLSPLLTQAQPQQPLSPLHPPIHYDVWCREGAGKEYRKQGMSNNHVLVPSILHNSLHMLLVYLVSKRPLHCLPLRSSNISTFTSPRSPSPSLWPGVLRGNQVLGNDAANSFLS